MPIASMWARLDHLRRRATLAAMHGGLAAAGRLEPHHALGLGQFVGRLAGLPSPLRGRLARNMRRAGLDPTPAQLDRYFRLLGTWFGQSMALYHHGFQGSGLGERIVLDESARHLRAALALGRGALMAEFHYHCHEIGGAAIAQQFPITGIVRESKDPAHDAVKQRWYRACGFGIVSRPRGQSLQGPRRLLTVLRENRVLVVSTDALGPAGEGVPVRFFGRRVQLPAGLISLAIITGVPVVFSWPEWQFSPGGDRLIIRFDEPLTFGKGGDREAALRAGMQQWASRLEAVLRRQPECWMHWLDKQWSRVWQGKR